MGHGHSHSHDDGHRHRHGHDHSHGHGGAGHCHAPTVTRRNLRVVGWAAIITGLFVVVEIIGGVVSGSLALIADAGHMLTDFAALAMAWAAFRLALRPPTARLTYGYDRVPVLVAFVNGLTLFALSAWIVWEAAARMLDPGPVLAGPMFWVAVAGLLVNIAVFAILQRADPDNLNIRGAMLHVLGDLLGSAAAILAAIIIWTTGWVAADPILSVLVALLILKSAWTLIRDSGFVLLQGAPESLDVEVVSADLLNHLDGLEGIETLHAWSLSPDRPRIALSATLRPGGDANALNRAIKARLRDRFGVDDALVDLIQGRPGSGPNQAMPMRSP